jgi:ATP-binding cassette, subfamily F, member 3
MVLGEGKTVIDEALSAFSEILDLEREISSINDQLAGRKDHESADYFRIDRTAFRGN